jgi:hypothetical protein
MTRLLQQAPPAVLTEQQATQLYSTSRALQQLAGATQETDTAETVQILSAVLQQQAARDAGILMAWTQQQPEQLFGTTTEGPRSQQNYPPTIDLGVAAASWCCGAEFLGSMLVKARTLDSSSQSTHSIVSAITEQLNQSGVWSGFNALLIVGLNGCMVPCIVQSWYCVPCYSAAAKRARVSNTKFALHGTS